MDAAVLDYGLEAQKNLNQTRSDLSPSETSPSLTYSHFMKGGLANLMPVLALSFSVATGFITDFDRLPNQLKRDQLSSAREMNHSQKAQRISLREARQIALQVLAETEKNLQEERMAEARFIASLWDNDTQDA